MVKRIGAYILMFAYMVFTLFLAVPHHTVTENSAIDLACEYFLYRMNDPNLRIVDVKAKKVYKDNEGETVSLCYNKFVEYWDLNLIYYSVCIKTNKHEKMSFLIDVDSYTGYIQDKTEGIMWNRPYKEVMQEVDK